MKLVYLGGGATLLRGLVPSQSKVCDCSLLVSYWLPLKIDFGRLLRYRLGMLRRTNHFWISLKEVRAASLASPGSGLMAMVSNVIKTQRIYFSRICLTDWLQRYKVPLLLRCLRVALERLSGT